MRTRGLPSGERDKLNATIRVEGPDKGLSERSEAAEESLVVVEVGEALSDAGWLVSYR